MRSKGNVCALVSLALVVLVVGPGWCGVDQAAKPAVAEAIRLQHIPPVGAMFSLGLVTPDDYLAGKVSTWSASDTVNNSQASVSAQIPSGIRMVAPYESDKALVVYGEKAAIDELKSALALIDVQPKIVQVKAEIYRLSSEQMKELGMDTKGDIKAITDAAALKELQAKLREANIALLASPIISTINNLRAELAISGDPQHMCSFTVLPRINRDKSITLHTRLKLATPDSESGGQKWQETTTHRRVANGETIVLSGSILEPGETEIVFLTAKIID